MEQSPSLFSWPLREFVHAPAVGRARKGGDEFFVQRDEVYPLLVSQRQIDAIVRGMLGRARHFHRGRNELSHFDNLGNEAVDVAKRDFNLFGAHFATTLFLPERVGEFGEE